MRLSNSAGRYGYKNIAAKQLPFVAASRGSRCQKSLKNGTLNKRLALLGHAMHLYAVYPRISFLIVHWFALFSQTQL